MNIKGSLKMVKEIAGKIKRIEDYILEVEYRLALYDLKLDILYDELLVRGIVNLCNEAIMDERDPPVESRNEVERGTRGPV